MFNIFKGKTKKFVSDKQHKENRNLQLSMSPQTVEQLRSYGVTEEKHLKLEYFFYTNLSEKVESLSSELSSMGYVCKFGASLQDKKTKIITGWSTPILMSSRAVLGWTAEMCDIGYKHDCEFDGWGTNPEQ